MLFVGFCTSYKIFLYKRRLFALRRNERKMIVEPCLIICSFCWSDSYLHGRLFWQFCNYKFKEHPSEQYYSPINVYSNVQRNHGFKRMRGLITSLACFRNILADFTLNWYWTLWNNKKLEEIFKSYRTGKNYLGLISKPNTYKGHSKHTGYHHSWWD